MENEIQMKKLHEFLHFFAINNIIILNERPKEKKQINLHTSKKTYIFVRT